MAVYERLTRIEQPLSAVWAFHVTPRSLLAVTPDWLGMRIEAVSGSGSPTDEFERGDEIDASVRPAGFGPRITWTSRIVSKEVTTDSAMFRDRMVVGPFPQWEHTHRFVADGDSTILIDTVEYELPLGSFRGASGLALPGFAAVFADRHRRTRRQLER